MSLSKSDPARRLRRKQLAFFCGVLMLLLVLGRTALLRDPGTFWHTAVGDHILETGRLPVVDEYTHTFGGRPWIAHQWLGECLMALAHRFAGFDGLLLVSAAALAWVFSDIARLLLRTGLHWLVVTVLLGMVFAASAYSFHARPHIATMVLMGVLFGVLSDIESGERAFGWLWVLVPLFVLWTNLHGGALGGLCTLALVIAGWSAAGLIGWTSPIADCRSFLTSVGVVIACGLSTLANPYGLEIPRTWWAIMDAELPQLIVEHAPLDPRQPEGQFVLLFGAVYLLVLVGIERRPRVTWLIPFVWLALATMRIRHAPLFAIVTGVAIADLLPHTRWRRLLSRRGYLTALPELPLARTAIFAPLLITGTLLVGAGVGRRAMSEPSELWARPDSNVWPIEVLAQLEQSGHDEKARNIFNEMHFGGFLIANAQWMRTFIDDRCELFGDAFLFEYVRGESDSHVIEEWIARFGIEAALTRPGSPFDDYFDNSPRWSVAAGCDTATFYELVEDEPTLTAEMPQ